MSDEEFSIAATIPECVVSILAPNGARGRRRGGGGVLLATHMEGARTHFSVLGTDIDKGSKRKLQIYSHFHKTRHEWPC